MLVMPFASGRFASTALQPREHAAANLARDFTCPNCGGELIRVARRPADRILSMVVPVKRFRCPDFRCQFEGILCVDD